MGLAQGGYATAGATPFCWYLDDFKKNTQTAYCADLVYKLWCLCVCVHDRGVAEGGDF